MTELLDWSLILSVFVALCGYGFVSGLLRSVSAWLALAEYYEFPEVISVQLGNKEPSSIHATAYLPVALFFTLVFSGITAVIVSFFL